MQSNGTDIALLQVAAEAFRAEREASGTAELELSMRLPAGFHQKSPAEEDRTFLIPIRINVARAAVPQ